MLAALELVFPALLGGLAAVAAPVIIHLIMRTKPRTVDFPALRFVKKTHRANLSKLKLKHLLLLLMRMAAIALVVLLLARPLLSAWFRAPDRSVPAAAVIVLDDSASMGYRHQDRSRLDLGRRLAQAAVDELPAGSRVAVLRTSAPAEPATLMGERALVARQIADVTVTSSARPVGPAIARALALLAGVEDLQRKELYVVTDMTARGWRDFQPAELGDGVEWIALHVGVEQPANLALGSAELSSPAIALGQPLNVTAEVASRRLGGEVPVRLELGDRPVDQALLAMEPGGSASATLSAIPDAAGLLHAEVALGATDGLAADDVRYVTARVGRPARAIVIREPAVAGVEDRTATLLAAALAAQGPWLDVRTVSADRLDADALTGARIAVLAGVASMTDDLWDRLGQFVSEGGYLWTVTGPMMVDALGPYRTDAARRLLPARLGQADTLAQPITFAPADLSAPMLRAFALEGNPPLTEVRTRRRLTVESVASGAQVVLRYADKVPAIAVRPIGQGRSLLWNLSPDPGLSNVGQFPRPHLPILAGQAVSALLGSDAEPARFIFGQPATVSVPASAVASPATVQVGNGPGEPVVLPPGGGELVLPADRLGHWTVRFHVEDGPIVKGFSVNLDPAESDLEPLGPEDLARRIGPERFLLVRSAEELTRRRRLVSRPLDLTAAILLLAVALLTAEAWFANRFYRQPAAPA